MPHAKAPCAFSLIFVSIRSILKKTAKIQAKKNPEPCRYGALIWRSGSTQYGFTKFELGIITGGANSDWQLAAKEGLDAYVTGEISEHDWHESQENGIHMFAGGHHATEQFGIQALMEKTRGQFDVDCFFIDSDNPA